MTKEDFLKIKGYAPADWDIMSPETSSKYLPEKGSINNMFEIKERKDIMAIGGHKGCYIVKKSWMMDVIDRMEDEGRSPGPSTNKQVTETPVPPTAQSVPPPPIPKSAAVPLPPLKEEIDGKVVQVADEAIEVVQEVENFHCDKYEQTSEACEHQCAFCTEKELVKPNVEDLYAQSHEAIDKAINAKNERKAIRLKTVESMGLVQDGANFLSKDKSYGISVEKLNTCSDEEFDLSISKMKEHIESLADKKSKEVAKEKIESIVKASGVPADKVFVGGIPKLEITEEIKASVIVEGVIDEDPLSVELEEEKSENIAEEKRLKEFKEVEKKVRKVFDQEKLSAAEMKLRNKFAGQALTGLLFNPNTPSHIQMDDLAKESFRIADIMLKESKL